MNNEAKPTARARSALWLQFRTGFNVAPKTDLAIIRSLQNNLQIARVFLSCEMILFYFGSILLIQGLRAPELRRFAQ